MTIPPATTEPAIGRRGIAAALIAAVLLLVAGYAAVASVAVKTVSIARSGALLANVREDVPPKLGKLSGRTVRAAIAAMPLDQGIANVAMMRDARRGGAHTTAWLATLSRMGWRDTAALQNLLFAAANAGELTSILDLGDALLRRRQLMDELLPIVSTLESDQALRVMLANRLAGNPSWRGAYFSTTAQLKDQAQLVARHDFIQLMLQRGRALDPNEVIPNIVALDRAELPRHAFALWQRIQPDVTRPLDDTRFLSASRSYDSGRQLVPYQWQTMAGEGFSADASRDGERTALRIDWNGRGVPVFAQQRTSAMPGMYALDLAVPPAERAQLSGLAFRLMCDGKVVALRPDADPSRYVTAASVPCAYPVLQIAGGLQSSAAEARQVTIERIVMRPIGDADRPR